MLQKASALQTQKGKVQFIKINKIWALQRSNFHILFQLILSKIVDSYIYNAINKFWQVKDQDADIALEFEHGGKLDFFFFLTFDDDISSLLW